MTTHRIKNVILLLSFISISVTSIAQTTTIDSFMVGGLMRNFRLYVPAMYNAAAPVPLVLNLHGYTSNAFEQAVYSNLNAVADTANFIVAIPNGTFDNNNDQYWNNFDGSNVDDIGFLSALIDTLSNRYSINQNRVYSTGMSNGGFMSYELACFLNNRIAAIASVAGTMVPTHYNSCNPQHPTPVMHIHGTADATVPYNGTNVFVPADTLVKYWVNFNHCNPTPVFTALPDVNTADGCSVEHYVYSGGNQSSTVELFKVLNGGHTWPGAAFNVGVTNQDFSATREIWRFFSQFSLDELIGVTPVEEVKPIAVYPNPASDRIYLSGNIKNGTITDLSGKVIMNLHVNTSGMGFDISDLPEGMYFVNTSLGVQKVIVSRK